MKTHLAPVRKFELLLIVFGFMAGIVSCNESVEKKFPPNVVMICVDDMNGYGLLDQYSLIQMPYLDKFKNEAVLFSSAVCNTPVCNPSRASFFSGLLPHNTGAYLNGSDAWNKSGIHTKLRSLPECFKDNGYETWGRGKIFHSPLDSAREFAMWDNRPIYKGGFGPFGDDKHWVGGSRFRSIQPWTGPDIEFPDVKNADAAVDFLEQEHEKPFFLYYGLWRPHSPYTAPKRFFDQYDINNIIEPPGYLKNDLDDVPQLGRDLVDSLKSIKYPKGVENEEQWKQFIWAYCANSSFADWNVGKVIEALDKSKYAENTIVVFFSDNGFHCGEKERWGKATLWEQADNTPILIRTPEKRSWESKATVSLVDIYPTLIDYCGLEPPLTHTLDGKSMVRLLKDPNEKWDHPSFTSYGIEYSTVRTENYRYCRYPDGSEELYDRNVDPFELTNIAGQPGTREIMDVLAKHIPEKWAPSVGGRLEVKRNYRTDTSF